MFVFDCFCFVVFFLCFMVLGFVSFGWFLVSFLVPSACLVVCACVSVVKYQKKFDRFRDKETAHLAAEMF